MKLIDLLVQELPKRGGWPEGAEYCWQDWDKEVRFDDIEFDFFVDSLCENHRPGRGESPNKESDESVTREQYLAASKQPAWNGKGLPPVGCECEAFDGAFWFPVVIVGRYDGFAFAWNSGYTKTFTVNEEHSKNFRPIRTEAERKRNEAIRALQLDEAKTGVYILEAEAEAIYDAIAAGEIPGVKIDDI